MPDIHIYGGGMSGLTAALLLEEQNIEYQLYETQSHWGGKLQTTHQEGFALDHGFQVIQSAYPAMDVYHKRGYMNDALAFGSGAWLLSHGKKTLLADPLREFPKGLAALGHSSIKLTDVWRVAKLRNQLLQQSPESFFQSSTVTTLQYLQQQGFSPSFIDAFFKPFFTGIFLEEALNTPCSMFQFVFWALAKGKACLLPGGIQTLPNRIVAQLNPQKLHLNVPVTNASNTPVPQTHFSTQAHYFAVDSDLGLGKFIGLNASNSGAINLMAIPSAVQSGYAPRGKHLLCVSVKPSVSHPNCQATPDQIRFEAEQLLGTQIHGHWLNSFTVPQALPADTKYQYGYAVSDGVGESDAYVLEFHATGSVANPSLNAAILHGMSFVSSINCR